MFKFLAMGDTVANKSLLKRALKAEAEVQQLRAVCAQALSIASDLADGGHCPKRPRVTSIDGITNAVVHIKNDSLVPDTPEITLIPCRDLYYSQDSCAAQFSDGITLKSTISALKVHAVVCKSNPAIRLVFAIFETGFIGVKSFCTIICINSVDCSYV